MFGKIPALLSVTAAFPGHLVKTFEQNDRRNALMQEHLCAAFVNSNTLRTLGFRLQT
jgi:hypothetical protein